MALEELKNAKRVIGIKQVTKAVTRDAAACVFLADDADERVVGPLRHLCEAKGVEMENVATMRKLGTACSIEVGAAAAAVLK